MSDVFAEATVKISPSLTGFKTDLEKQLKEIMDKVTVKPVRIKPALSVDFVGDLRKQVNEAIVKAQGGIKPIRVKALIEPIGVAAGKARVVPGTPGGGGGGSGGGGGGAGRVGGANTALARSLEQVVVAQRNLNAAFDESLPLKEQINAVTKVTTALDDAQEAAERSLTKAIVAKDAAAKKAAQRQLTDIEDFRRNIAARVAQVQTQVPVPAPKADAGTKAAIASTRKLSDSFKSLVADIHKVDAAEAKLGTSTADLAARKDLLRKRTQQLEAVSKLETKAGATSNALVQQAIVNAKLRATAAVESAQKQVAALESVAKAEAAAAKQTQATARAQEAARRKSDQAAARAAASERRRSEQLSRGGQASLLSLAGIRGATLAASRSFLVGAAAITVFAKAVKQFADLERNMHVFAATTSATADQMEEVRKEATELGADLTLPAVSAGDAAGAMVELAKAGLTVQDSIDGARAVLELATAAAIDNADAVRLVANVLNAFSLAGRDASAVADTLANAANAAQGSIADIGTAFQQAASAGHQVGLSFQDTATFLTILAKNGIRGSDAGTSLRTALIRLVNPSKKAQEAFEQLGITLRDTQGNLRPDVFLQIAEATSRLGPAQRDATIALIGGQDAFRAVTILGRQSVDSFLAMRKALREEGTAAELARARTEGLHGAMDGLESVLETVGTNLARHVGPGLAGFVHEVSASITALSESERVASSLNQVLGATADSFNALGRAINATLTVALPLASVFAKVATGIGVSNILAGVVAFKALNAVLDGAIFRIRLLKPLFAILATAKIGSQLSTGLTAAQIALAKFNLERGALEKTASGGFFGLLGGIFKKRPDPKALEGFQRLVQVEKELAVQAAAAARPTSALRVALGGVGSGALAAATSTGGLTVAVAALAAGFVFLATRESNLNRATRQLREETDKLADALDRVDTAGRGLESAGRAAQQAQTGVQQAQLNLRAAQEAAGQSDAPAGSRERRQLLLSVRIATQDLTFANQDLKRSFEELAIAQGEQRAAEAQTAKARGTAAKALRTLIVRERERAASIARQEITSTGQGLGGKQRVLDLRTEVLTRERLIQTLREQAAAEAESTEDSERQIAVRKRIVAALVDFTDIDTKKFAPDLSRILVTEGLDPALRQAAVIAGKRGKEAIDAFVQAVHNALSRGQSLAGAIRDALKAAEAGSAPTAVEVGSNTADFFEHGFAGRFASTVGPNITNIITASLSGATKLALAELKGESNAVLLDIAQNTLRIATSVRERAEAKFAAHPTGEEGKKNKEFVDRAVAAEQAALADVERIQGDIDAAQKDQEEAIDNAIKVRNERAQKIIDNLLEGRKATLLQRRITRAGLTAWLGDDRKATQDWLDYLKSVRDALAKRLRAVGASKAVIASAMKQISDLIFQTTVEVKRINNDIKKNQEQQAKSILESLAVQKIDIRIRIAETQENVAAELALRRRKLQIINRELKKLARQHKQNTLAYLELQLAQAEEIAAIRELTATQKQKINAESQMQFQFLQMQSGFVANLLGNLIPGGATGGLVGGGGFGGNIGGGPGGLIGETLATIAAPSGLPGPRGRDPLAGGGSGGVSQAVDKAVGVKSATGGPTRGGQATELHLLKQILSVLLQIQRGTTHPEARNRRARDQNNFELAEHK